MQKRGLKDIKRRNRHVILQTVLDNKKLSRVEIVQKTELAPSTVSTLVAEMIEQGYLIESGSQITAGRSRTELTLNPDYGTIAVLEVNRKGVELSVYDMALQVIERKKLSEQCLTGNELFDEITNAVDVYYKKERPLAGIGLLFQQDMRESDFRIMYSTGAAAASITLKEALVSRYKIFVTEDYGEVYNVSRALSEQKKGEVRNSAHISLGERVVINVTQENMIVPIRSDFFETATSFLEDLVPETEGKKTGSDRMKNLVMIIQLLCMIFPLNIIFLSGTDISDKEDEKTIRRQLAEKLPEKLIPQIRFLFQKSTEQCTNSYAQRLRSDILFNH